MCPERPGRQPAGTSQSDTAEVRVLPPPACGTERASLGRDQEGPRSYLVLRGALCTPCIPRQRADASCPEPPSSGSFVMVHRENSAVTTSSPSRAPSPQVDAGLLCRHQPPLA